MVVRCFKCDTFQVELVSTAAWLLRGCMWRIVCAVIAFEVGLARAGVSLASLSQVKKSTKWKCKLCAATQSVRQVGPTPGPQSQLGPDPYGVGVGLNLS